MTDQRGGVVIKTGKIGRVNCLRQQLVAPGETINTDISGKVMLEATRERETLRIHAHLATFLTPLRWLEPNWATYIKEGPETVTSIATETRDTLSGLGIGADGTSIVVPHFWEKAYLRIYNEWYKWPEAADTTNLTLADGLKAVPLQHTWSRVRDTIDPTASADYTASTASSDLDVRDLAKIQARFRSAMERDVLSYNRYMELVSEMFDADGSREVDQVPMMIDQTDLGVNPRELPATDAAGLGDWQSVYDFGMNHSIRGVTAPEHSVLSYVLCVRFAPIIEGRNPLSTDGLDWEQYVGDPEILRNSKPEPVRRKDVETTNSTTQLGYLPAGWRWRSQWDVIGKRVDLADSFPMMNAPTSSSECRDATRIKDAFRSAALGDYICDLEFSERSRNLHGAALESYFSGMTGGASDATYPKQGKML